MNYKMGGINQVNGENWIGKMSDLLVLTKSGKYNPICFIG